MANQNIDLGKVLPVKGVDYFTEEEKEEIEGVIRQELQGVVDDATSATAAANNAASNAEQKAGVADTAAANANQKAGYALDAAGLATSKANLANTAAGRANAAADAANEAMETFSAQEAVRQQNESARQQAEGVRQQTFVANEASRQSTFEQNESARQSAETTRQSNESARQTNESNRQTAESAREVNESVRQTQESQRQSAETARQQTFETNETARQQAASAQRTQEAQTATAQRQSEAQTAADQRHSEAQTASAQRAAEEAIFEEKESERDAAIAIATALTPRVSTLEGKVEGIEEGTNVPAYADNLKSWAERSSVVVSDEWDAVAVRTTAGSLSVNTAEGAHLISVRSNGDFSASGFKASPFNLIIASQKVGGVPYILVPACVFGTFGTADENNGILVTNAQGQNKQVAMRFKTYADGVPESVSDGVACPYRDAGGYRFYLPASAGYIWAADMSDTDCAHIAWSKDYDHYEAPSAFSSISFATIINKFTSIGSTYHMLAIDDRADNFVFDGTKFIYEKVCGYDTSEWTNTAITDEGGQITGYRHEKTISAMAADTKAKDYAGLVELTTNGKVVSYEDSDATSSVAVVYELETHTTGDVTLANSYQPNDMGLEYIEGMTGQATIVTTYFQGLPDEVAALPSKVASLEAELKAKIEALGAQAEGLAETIDNIITGKMMIAVNAIRDYYHGQSKRTYGVGYFTIKPTFGIAATITFSYNVNTYAFAFDLTLTAEDTVYTFKDKFKAAIDASMSYLGVKPNVAILDDGTGISLDLDTDTEVEINTVACSGATLAETSDHPTTAPAFIGQLYHNSNKKKEWEGKSVRAASDWAEKY